MNVLSAIYGLAVARRNRRYDEHLATIARAGVPVISVGNISVGGTGKTPFVQFVVRELLALGYRPAVISRGYGRNSRGEVVVSDGASVLVSVEQAGDELMMHAEHLAVPVIANADRAAGARTAERLFGVDAIVLDDGFQHRRLHRDCDIVLVDEATLRHPVLLPAGRLREPLSSLGRADIICGVGGVQCADISAVCPAASALCVEAVTRAGELRCAFSREIAQLSTKDVVAVAGIARPSRFFTSLSEQHIVVAGQLVFGDHHKYNRRDVQRMAGMCRKHNCTTVATTEKDAVKLRGFREVFDSAGIRLVVLPVELHIVRGYQQLRHTFSTLFERRSDENSIDKRPG